MAIYHSRVKVFSRSRGDSAVAAAAYRAGLLLIVTSTFNLTHRGNFKLTRLP
ncbi:hypothetical protein [Xanthomonas phaseoli]|uniref:hypothetical protein n=1 Tax=Xanthomonas phaseoli TaxID=1985254 RepID=UPI00286913C9|nr:hypothetical protein [Xanthomonas phaseoli]